MLRFIFERVGCDSGYFWKIKVCAEDGALHWADLCILTGFYKIS
jgi:hypothetical protein